MGALGLKEESKPRTQEESDVSIKELSDLTGFPADFIKRELLLNDDQDLSLDELRKKVLRYLDSNF